MAYKTLNKAQKEAVDSIEGPVMVIAGPGTGKTQILTLRIANILRITDTRPENILAITSTEAGANAMRKRLLSIIGEDAYKVVIQTFHGFSNNLITDFPEYFEKIIGRSPANEIDVINIIEKIIDSNDFKIIKPYGDKYYYVKSIRSSIKSLKQEACDVETFEQFIKSKEDELINSNDKYHEKGPHKGKVKASYLESEKNINKNKELLVVYRSYEDELSKSKLYDFEDMLLESYKALRDKKDLLLTLQENYQYILAVF
jgi:DNA helicase-2/ATP-dependent DNA helicase PcrA